MDTPRGGQEDVRGAECRRGLLRVRLCCWYRCCCARGRGSGAAPRGLAPHGLVLGEVRAVVKHVAPPELPGRHLPHRLSARLVDLPARPPPFRRE